MQVDVGVSRRGTSYMIPGTKHICAQTEPGVQLRQTMVYNCPKPLLGNSVTLFRYQRANEDFYSAAELDITVVADTGDQTSTPIPGPWGKLFIIITVRQKASFSSFP